MPTGDYLEGAVVFASMLAGVSAGALLICRRRLPWLRGAPQVLALGIATTLAILVVHLLPGMLGVLSREAVLVATALLAGVAALLPATAAASVPGPPAAPLPAPGAWLPAALALAVTGTFAVAMAIDQAVLAPGSVDILNFHLPGVGAWMQSGSIWAVDNFLADVAPGNYPNHGDVVLLAAVLPWSNDFLSHLAIYPFWALTGVAVYALARELRAPRPVAAVAACLLLVIPAVAIPALVHSFPDAILLAGFSTGVLFGLRHHRGGATAELVLAALALGLAFGTKWYGVSSVAVVFAVWVVASLLAGRRLATVARQGALVIGLVTLAGGIWLLRNWIGSGNPFFPVKVSSLGIEIFDAPRDLVREVFGFTIADYIDDPAVWGDAILPQYRDALAVAGAILVAGLLVALATLARRGLPQRATAATLALATLGLALAYSITPYTAAGLAGEPVLVGADSRYLIPALLLAAALVAWAAGTWRWGALAFGVLALPALIDGVRLSSDGSSSGAVLEADKWLPGAAVVALVAALAWALREAWRMRPLAPRAKAALAAGLVLLVAVAVLGGNEVQQRFNETRYLGGDPTTDHLLTEAPSGNRIGLANNWDDDGIAPPLPAFGPRYGNEVEYVGTYVQGMQRQYTERAGFTEALAEGEYDYLVIGRGRPPKPLVAEERWAQSVGFERVVASERLALYRAP